MWKARLRDLLHDCAASTPDEQADRIREAHALLWLSPGQAERFAGPARDVRTLDALLALGAHESAVISLFGGDSAFMVSRGANGNCLASVVAPGGSEELVAEGSTLALALLCAHISSVLADGDTASGAAAKPDHNAALRLN